MKLAYIRAVIRKLISIKTRWDPKLILAILFSISFWAVLFLGSLGAFDTSKNTTGGGEAAERGGEVFGIKVERAEGAKPEPDSASPAPGTPTASGAPEARATQTEAALPAESTAGNPVKDEPAVPNPDLGKLNKLADFDTLVPYTGGGFNISKGTVSFDVMADWGEGDRTLLLLNFNGQDTKNLFEILATGSLIEFNTYDNTGENGKEVRAVSFEGALTGKINIRLTWDFGAEPKIKRIFIDGKRVMEAKVENVPTEANAQILMGKVENLQIQ